MREKRVIIVGATSGLGRRLAERYIAAGCTVGVAGRNVVALKELTAIDPERVKSEVIDITAEDAPRRLSELISSTGGMDLYIHCSGILKEEKELDISGQTDIVATNVTGFVRMLSAVYRYYRDDKEKRKQKPAIAAISSIAGVRGLGDLPAYSASKAFDSTYLEALRQKADKEGVKVTITDIKPGWTRTALLNSNRRYILEMDSAVVVNKIYDAINNRKPLSVIGIRWKILTAIERSLPRGIWRKLHIPLWRDNQ